MGNMSNFVKRVRDIMRNDAGINGDAQRIEQIAWMLFLKVYDAKEQDWEFSDDNYHSIIPEPCRWRKWAHDENGQGMTGDTLLDFVNNTLFPTLKNLPVDASTPIKKAIVQTTFADANNYMKDGVLLRQVIGVIDELDLTDYEESHAFGEIYETILKELQSAGSAGEFYTPRAVTDFMAQMIDPQLGETMADFACGTGGFITSWLKELKKKVKTTEDEEKYANSIYGIEKKQFPYMLCITNMLLHDLDVPQVFHERFPENFRFQLTAEEYTSLRSQFVTSNGRGGRRYLPYAFTEQGIAMLSGVLRSDVAVQMSIRIMNTFVEMRRFIANNALLFERISSIELKQLEYQKSTDERFDKVFQCIDNHAESQQKIFFDGQIYDAFSLLVSLIQKAEREIVLIDGYVDVNTLNLLAKKQPNVRVKCYTYASARLTNQDSIVEMDMLVLSLVKVLLDSLNEKEIVSHLTGTYEKLVGSISKLEVWFQEKQLTGYQDHIKFLRNLQELRSSGTGHRKGKSYQKISKVFDIQKENYTETFSNILESATLFLNYINTHIEELSK